MHMFLIVFRVHLVHGIRKDFMGYVEGTLQSGIRALVSTLGLYGSATTVKIKSM
jgi:hypothetical protein